MPNHVYSSMTITGEVAAIKTFAEKHFDGGQLDLSSFVAMPKELKGTVSPSHPPHNGSGIEITEYERKCKSLIEKYGFDNWYDWCIENWGTKWNTYDGDVDVMDDTIACTFQTAWGLPEPIFVVMGKMYPTLEFNLECVEEGGFFSGTLSIVNGVVDDSGITDDNEQWQRLAEEYMGWMFDED